MCVYFLAIFPLPDIQDIDMNAPVSQLLPFNFVFDIIKESSNMKSVWLVFSNASIYTVLFNVLMFIPFGMYLRYYFKNDLKKTVLFSFLFSLFLEFTQLTGLYFIYPHPYRLFDVDDLMINTLGGLLGYFIMGIFMRFLPSREAIDLDSLKDGMQVSGLRRITRFGLDLFLYLIFTSVLGVVFKSNLSICVCLVIYYVFIPYVFGQTLGSKFLNMKLVFPNKRLIRLFLRLILLLLYYIVLPFGLGYGLVLLARITDLSNLFVFVLGAIYVVGLGIFYLVNLTRIFQKKTLFYDKVVHGEYVSTIGGA